MSIFVRSGRSEDIFIKNKRPGITSEVLQEMMMQQRYENIYSDCCIKCRYYHVERQLCNEKTTVKVELEMQGIDNSKGEIISVPQPTHYSCTRFELKF